MKEKAKIVKTKDLNGKDNGFLIELKKSGDKTDAYLSAANPGCFKGYHLHVVRQANYVCVRGKVKVILYKKGIGREEIIMEQGDKLHIDTNVPTGIQNEWADDAWLINFPNPAYDPNLKGEQIDMTEEEAEKWVYDYS